MPAAAYPRGASDVVQVPVRLAFCVCVHACAVRAWLRKTRQPEHNIIITACIVCASAGRVFREASLSSVVVVVSIHSFRVNCMRRRAIAGTSFRTPWWRRESLHGRSAFQPTRYAGGGDDKL